MKRKIVSMSQLPRRNAARDGQVIVSPTLSMKKARKLTPPKTQDPRTRGAKAHDTRAKRLNSPALTLHDLRRRRDKPPLPPVVAGTVLYEEIPTIKYIHTVLPKGHWQGRRCFILAGGPSLAKVDLTQLDGELTIGVNRLYEKYYPTLNYCMDSEMWGWIARGDFGAEAAQRWDAYRGYKLFSEFKGFICPDPDIYSIPLTDTSPCGSNSGHAMIRLAITLGANPIYLLGFDMAAGRGNSLRWWHDGYSGCPHNNGGSANIYKGWREALADDAPALTEHTEIVNLNPHSGVKVFPFSTLHKVLGAGKVTAPPVYVSFYTNAAYQHEAERLTASLHRTACVYDVVPESDMGWVAAVRYKPEFLLNMLDKHPDNPIVWVDADAIMVSSPDEFIDPPYDIGVHTVNWADYPMSSRSDRETLSGTIYLRNTEMVRDFLRAWIAGVKASPTLLEQAVLQRLVRDGTWTSKLRIANIPPAYCQIFDSMGMIGEPVIEHFQASRRLRNG